MTDDIMLKARHGQHRYLCHCCDWERSMHFWLPFDFELARMAYSRHLRRCRRHTRP